MPGMPSLGEVDVERNEDDPEAVLEKALEDFSQTDSYAPKNCSFMQYAC